MACYGDSSSTSCCCFSAASSLQNCWRMSERISRLTDRTTHQISTHFILVSSSVPNKTSFDVTRLAPELIVSIAPRHDRRKAVSALMTCHNCFSSSNIFQTNYAQRGARNGKSARTQSKRNKIKNKIVSNSFALAKCDRAENVETITTQSARQKRKI